MDISMHIYTNILYINVCIYVYKCLSPYIYMFICISLGLFNVPTSTSNTKVVLLKIRAI